MRIACALGLLVAGCATETAESCPPWNGAHEIVSEEVSGTCGPIPTVAITFMNQPIDALVNGCEGSRVAAPDRCSADIDQTCPLNDDVSGDRIGAVRQTGKVYRDERASTLTWAVSLDDGTRCTSTYRVTTRAL